MFLNSERWRKILLVGGLLLIMAQGLVRVPEVGVRLFPGMFWEVKLRLTQKECLRLERSLHYIGATLEELNGPKEPGHPPGTTGPFGDSLVLSQSWAHLPEIWGRLLPKMSDETKLRLAQKECIKVERSLKYINATMEALNRALDHKLPQGAAGSLPTAADLSQARDLTQAIRRRCWGYRQELKDFLKKWQDLKISQNKKAGLESR